MYTLGMTDFCLWVRCIQWLAWLGKIQGFLKEEQSMAERPTDDEKTRVAMYE
jgi:hypothetical protein